MLAGTIAVSTGLALSGALHETMPLLAIVPALSAIKQANDGHVGKYWSLIHAAVLLTGASVGVWLYMNGVIGKVWLDQIAAMP